MPYVGPRTHWLDYAVSIHGWGRLCTTVGNTCRDVMIVCWCRSWNSEQFSKSENSNFCSVYPSIKLSVWPKYCLTPRLYGIHFCAKTAMCCRYNCWFLGNLYPQFPLFIHDDCWCNYSFNPQLFLSQSAWWAGLEQLMGQMWPMGH